MFCDPGCKFWGVRGKGEAFRPEQFICGSKKFVAEVVVLIGYKILEIGHDTETGIITLIDNNVSFSECDFFFSTQVNQICFRNFTVDKTVKNVFTSTDGKNYDEDELKKFKKKLGEFYRKIDIPTPEIIHLNIPLERCQNESEANIDGLEYIVTYTTDKSRFKATRRGMTYIVIEVEEYHSAF